MIPRALPAAAVLCLAACTVQIAPRAAPADLVVGRTYTFDAPVPDPQPAWNPADDRIAIRIANGFAVLSEGRSRQDVFAAQGARDRQHPVWLDAQTIVFGSSANVIALTDGRLSPPGQALERIDLLDTGDVKRTDLDRWGYRPRVGRGPAKRTAIFTQVEDRVRMVDAEGAGGEDFVDGFFAEPQADGPGLAWTATPIIEADHWTGSEGRGALIIRWRPGVVDTIPGCVQPRWVTGGLGVVATRLISDPPRPVRRPGAAGATDAWWANGTEVVWIRGPGQPAQVIATAARDPDPHPTHPLVAITRAAGGIAVASLDGSAAPAAIAEAGSRPRWNASGDRLLCIEPVLDRGVAIGARLVVRVLALRAPAPAAP